MVSRQLLYFLVGWVAAFSCGQAMVLSDVNISKNQYGGYKYPTYQAKFLDNGSQKRRFFQADFWYAKRTLPGCPSSSSLGHSGLVPTTSISIIPSFFMLLRTNPEHPSQPMDNNSVNQHIMEDRDSKLNLLFTNNPPEYIAKINPICLFEQAVYLDKCTPCSKFGR